MEFHYSDELGLWKVTLLWGVKCVYEMDHKARC